VKLYLDVSLSADAFVGICQGGQDTTDFATIAAEFLSQAFSTFEDKVLDAKVQYRCLVSMVGTLMASKSLSKVQYESFITKTAQCSARLTKKQEQCHLVALCAHLFYPVGSSSSAVEMMYSNPQRALECLQRCLKLADASTATNPSHVKLFVDVLEHYVFFFEKKNPSVTHGYISGLVALIKEHLSSLPGDENLTEAKSQFLEVTRYILKKKEETDSAQLFAPVNLG
jgi:vacuolar protein sorting-associated protein 35